MKILCYVFSCILLIAGSYFLIFKVQSPTFISTSLDEKKLQSSDFSEVHVSDEACEEVTEDDDESEASEDTLLVIDDSDLAQENSETAVEEEVSSSEVEVVSDVLETQVGSLSGYGPDCIGCSGFLASGLDVRDGNIYYSDSTYGKVRILAGDYSYPYGTIVRVKGSKLSEFIGIVLDRGGAVGFGKSHLFDLLYPTSSSALAMEVSYHTTFEILRYGY